MIINNGIKQEFSAPYSPHQNGTVERSWRTIFNMARCLLLDAKLPKIMWTHAIKTAVYIRNRCFNPRTGKTPYELFTGKKPNLSNMHLFGSRCHAYIQIKKKLDPRSEQGVFVGYDGLSPAYLVYFPERNYVRRVRIVKFNDKIQQETVVLEDDLIEYQTPEATSSRPAYNAQATEATIGEQPAAEVTPEPAASDERPACRAAKEATPAATTTGARTSRYPERQRQQPTHLSDYIVGEQSDDSSTSDLSLAKCYVDYCYRVADIPKNYTEAVNSHEKEKWQIAMSEEIKSLNENQTFDLVPSVPGKTVIGGRWVYAVKFGPDNKEKFKARYVAKGYAQIKDIDYQETFSPTARVTSVRMLLQHAIQEDLVVHQLDVKTAYLNANIDCEVYVDQPEGYALTNSNNEKLVCKLKKSLYGLKQSGRNWNNMLHTFLLGEHFEQSFADNCVYTRFVNNVRVIIIIWVDDMIIAASDNVVLNSVKISLCNKFKMKDIGQLSWFLGMEFEFEGDCIKMS